MGDPRMYEQFITHDDVEPLVTGDEGDEGDRVDVVEGPVGSASLKEPSEVESSVDPAGSLTLDATVDATTEPGQS